MQSALHPAAGSGAALIHELALTLYIGGALIFIFVMALAIYGVYCEPKRIQARRWIVGGGVVFPVIVLSALLVYSLAVGGAQAKNEVGGALRLILDCFSGQSQALSRLTFWDELRVEVVGKQWWWEVRYRPSNRDADIVLANELYLPVGRRVEVTLSTSDVIHSFWAPSLAGKVDMVPGRANRLVLNAAEPGVFRGQCAEYCGGQHALMAFYIVVVPQEEFDAWLARQAQPAQAPADPYLNLGYEAFFSGGCAECHAVRGTPAVGTLGPDLTHVGSRRSLAAGVMRNHIGTMAGWIAGAQDLKPGNFMPEVSVYSGRELLAVSAWLGSLQ